MRPQPKYTRQERQEAMSAKAEQSVFFAPGSENTDAAPAH
jgi:hypothetical protein